MAQRLLPVAIGILLAAMIGCINREDVPPPATPTDPEPEAPVIDVPAEDLKVLADGNNEFAFDLYKKLIEEEKGNIVVSPYSIRTALAMTYAGARGETAAEMRKVLHFTLPDDRLHTALGRTMQRLQSAKDSPNHLDVANCLWAQFDYGFDPDFLELTRNHYQSGFRELDFAQDPLLARQTINRWVAERTRDKIPELLTPEDVTTLTRLVLTNAIYFKGHWAKPFPEDKTIDDMFRVSAEMSVPVRMMNVHDVFYHFEEDGVQVLILPYVQKQQSMVVVLPTEPDGLAEVEQELTAAKLQEWFSSASEANVRVSLPVFRTQNRYLLAKTLSAGMDTPLPFEPTSADFSGIAGREGSLLHIKEVIHEAVVEVNEEGTEAAAATAVIMAVPASYTPPPRIVTFRADHPFLYMIVDHATETTLFMGRVTAP